MITPAAPRARAAVENSSPQNATSPGTAAITTSSVRSESRKAISIA